MAQVITGIDNIPFSAASAAYAPTNTAEVTGMIDSAVSGKLDASASSAFITSTAGCQPAGDYVSSSELADYQTTAGMSAYATTADLADKLDASASSAFITSTADCQPSGDYVSSSELAGYLPTSSIGVDSASAVTSIAGSSIGGGEQIVTSLETATSLGISGGLIITSTSVIGLNGFYLSARSADNAKTAINWAGATTKLDATASSNFVQTSSIDTRYGYVTAIDGTGIMGCDTAVFTSSGSSTGNAVANTPTALPDGTQTVTVSKPIFSTPSITVREVGQDTGITVTPPSVATTVTITGVDTLTPPLEIVATTGINFTADYVDYTTAQLAQQSSLAGYLPTSSIGVDSASAVTSIAGSSIAGGGAQVVTSITTGGYGVRAINGMGINASHMTFGAEAADNASNVVKLGNGDYGAGVFLSGQFGSAYYKVNELQLNRNGTGFIAFNIGGAGSQITATSNAGGKFTAGGKDGARSYYTAYNASASASIEVTGDSAKINLADSGNTSTIYPSSIPYWNGKLDSSASSSFATTAELADKLDASASSSFITSTAGLATTGDLENYQPTSSMGDYQTTAGMSAYATTGDLSGKLDASASSAFITSTANCQPSGDYVSSSELADYQTTAGMSFYATTGDLAVLDGIVSGKLDSSASSAFITSTAGLATTGDLENYQPTSSMGEYATTAELSGKLDSSASSAFITSTADCQPAGDYVSSSELADYQTTAGMSAYATTGDLSGKLDASASSAFITSTAGLATTGDLENYQTTAGMSAYQLSGNYQTAGDYVSSSELAAYQTTAGMSGYATTADLSAKLDASASSSFITSTAGLVSTGDLSAYLETSAIETSTAGVTGIAGTAIAGGGGGADWSAESGQPGYIENKPVPKTLVAGAGITITENASSLSVAANSTTYSAGSGLTLSGSTFSVDTGVVAMQSDLSGYATTADISDAVAALPTNLSSAQIQALKEALGCDETVLYESAAGMQLHNGLQLPETLYNFERVRFYVASSTSNGTPVSVEVPIQVAPYPNGTIALFFTNGHDMTSNFKLSWKWKMTFANNTLTLTLSQYWGQNGTSWTQGDNLNDATVYKIVGIHRIASN